MSLEDKIRAVAQKIYRADDIVIDKAVSDQLKGFEESGYGKLPICIAKTQYSFSTNPALRGAPTGFTVPVREVRLISRCWIYCCSNWSHNDNARSTKSSKC